MPDQPMPATLLEWRAVQRGTLLGFATIQLGALRIRDVSLHISNGRRWCGLPGRPQLTPDGRAKTNENGRVEYVSMIEWVSPESRARFNEAVWRVVLAQHPEALPPS